MQHHKIIIIPKTLMKYYPKLLLPELFCIM